MERKRTWFRAFHKNGEEEEKCIEKRLSLRERKSIKYTNEGIIDDNDKEEKNEEEVKDHLTSGLLVVCGTKVGFLDVKKLEGGKACIEWEGQLLTPPAFEFLGGKGAAKKWKTSIYYNKKPLKFWFEQGYLSTKGYMKGSRAIQKRKLLPTDCEPKEVSDGKSDIEIAEKTEEEDVTDDDWISSDEELAQDTEESEEGGQDEVGAKIDRQESKSEDDSVEMWDTDDVDIFDISDDSEDQAVVKEEDKLITSAPEKLGLQKEVKIIIKRLPVAKSDCQANCVEHLLEDTGNKSLSEDDHTEDLTGDSSATTDDLFFTSVMQNQPSQKSEVARTDSVEERRHQPRNIKTETPSYEQGEDGQLNMLCENEAKIRKREHLDISIYQYNNQQRAVEDGDLPSRTIPKQPLIENIFPPTLSPVSKPLSVLVPTHIATGTTSDMRTPPTSQMPQIVEVSSRAVSGSDKETMDLYQLKKEKIKMQLRVLKLQEEYYSLKLNELRKMTN